MAEQFTFQEILAERIAIDRDKRLVLAQAVVVDGTGDHFLAGATLACDQNRGTRRRALRDQAEDGLHGPAGTDDVFETILGTDLALEIPVLLQEVAPLQRAIHHKLQLIRVEGLGYIVKRTEFHGLDGRLYLRQTGHHDDINVGMPLFHLL